MWTLIALGVGAAYLYSVVATLFPGLFPHQFRGHGGTVPVYFEAAAVIVALVFLGQVLELRARERTGSAIRALLDLAPKTARRIAADGAEARRAARRGQRRRPPAHPPRRRRAGRRHRARRPLLGRRIDAHRRAGAGREGAGRQADRRHAQRQRLAGHAGREGRRRDHALAASSSMVAKAQRSRAPIQGLADRVSAWFVPAVVLVAIARLRRLGAVRPRAEHGLRHRLGGLGADHRLPLRAGPGDADVDHDGDRPRRAGRRADQGRRGAGALRQRRHADRRQDRHADRRQAEADRCRRLPTASTRADLLRSPPASRRAPSIRSPRRSSPAPSERGARRSPRPRTSRRSPARASPAASRAASVALGNAGADGRARRRHRAARRARRRAAAPTARR